jgi:hypothetical protein
MKLPAARLKPRFSKRGFKLDKPFFFSHHYSLKNSIICVFCFKFIGLSRTWYIRRKQQAKQVILRVVSYYDQILRDLRYYIVITQTTTSFNP